MRKSVIVPIILLVLGIGVGAYVYFRTGSLKAPNAAASMTSAEAADAVSKDAFYIKNWGKFQSCAIDVIFEEAFNHATTSSLMTAVVPKTSAKCGIFLKMATWRVCEFVQSEPDSPCANQGSDKGEKFIEERIYEMVANLLEVFDTQRVKDGLPPRPSHGK